MLLVLFLGLCAMIVADRPKRQHVGFSAVVIVLAMLLLLAR